MDRKTVKKQIEILKFTPKKFLGQNFLTNSSISEKIMSVLKQIKPQFIMEVGPGLGALTNDLMSLKIPFCVIEKDKILCRYWRDKKINVLEGDFLKFSWSRHLISNSSLIGNLSYQMASRLLVQCCPGPLQLQSMVLMFQKEVANRILSPCGSKSYGILSVLSQCFWNIQFLLEASVNDFYPRPKVAGRVLIFQKKEGVSLANPDGFLKFVKMCFSQRRKILLTRLKKETGTDVSDIFNKMNLPFRMRPEELSPDQFVSLFHRLKEKESNATEKINS